MPLGLFLFTSGAAGGFLSGLLGIGGGIIMFPVLFYLPPLLGLPPLDVKGITGLTMAQGFFAALAAFFFFRKEKLVSKDLVLTLGLSLFASSLAGALFSDMVRDRVLLFIFGVLAFFAAAMMLLPRSYAKDELKSGQFSFNRPLAAALGLFCGFFLGMVGQGGAFLIIPLMLYVLKVPLRAAIGSMLAIGLLSSTAGLAGKLAAGQVPYAMASLLLLGAVPASFAGALASRRANVRFLKWLLAAIIAGSAVKIWADIFKSGL